VSRARLLRGACAAVLLAPVVLVGSTGPSAAGPVGPSPGPGSPASPAPGDGSADAGTAPTEGLEVSSIAPAELVPGGTMTVRGRVHGGPDGLTGSRLAVRRAGSRSVTLSSLQRWTAAVDARPGPAAGDGPFEDPAATARTEAELDLGDVPAGGSVPFTVRLDADVLGLRDSSVAAGPYGLQLLLTTSEEVVDDERGFLVWSPEVDAAPTSLVTSVPLTSPPVLTSTGLPDPEVLRGEVVEGGRLHTSLDVASALDADWVVDPALLGGLVAQEPSDEAEQGADGTDPDGSTAEPSAGPSQEPSDEPSGGPSGDGSGEGSTEPSDAPPAAGPGAPTASEPSDGPAPSPAPPEDADPVAAWLDSLQQARRGREVLLTDWADPDPGRLSSADDTAQAWVALSDAQHLALPDDQVEELLSGRVRTDVVVPEDGRTTVEELSVLARGRSAVLLDEAVVPLVDPFALSYTADLVSTVTVGDSTMTAVLSDPTLTADTLAAVEGSPLATTRVLARLATTTLQRPNDQRLLAVHLPSTLRPAPGSAEQLAAALEATSWAEPTSLSTALGTPPSREAREPLPEGEPLETDPGVQPMLDALTDSRLVAGAVGDTDEGDLPLRVAATLSRDAEDGAAGALAEEIVRQTQATVDGIRVVPGSRVTLVAAQAALPVTVISELDSEVDLVLQVRSRSPRLQVPEQRVPVTVEPGQRAVVDVPVIAVASGPAEVTSQLVTEAGRPWGPPSTVTVTVATQAEGRVLAAIGVVVGVLFVVGAARAFVRNRRGRELEATGAELP
jgi:hypothetical protein